MTRTRVAPAAAVLLVAWAALWIPAAGAQTPSPSPSSSGSAAPSPSGAASSPTSAPAEEALAVFVSAEPETVEVGHATVVVAQVTNTGSAPVDEATLELELPGELELVDAFPAPSSSAGRRLTFSLGPLGPGESAVAQVTARGVDVVPAATVGATARAGTVVATDAVDVMVVVTGAPGGLTVTSRTEGVLTQVGSMVRYVVTVTNEGSEDLDDVLVVDLAPEELEVVSVDIVDAVEAVQIGETLGRYDIVWNVGSLPVGASVDLPWDGRVLRPGDLTAVNSVRGLLGPNNETVRATSRSFLAAEGPRDVANPPFDPIEKRVVTFVDPDPGAEPDARATTAPGVVLPLTGASLSRFAFAALMFVVAGAFVLGGARLAPQGSARTVLATAVAAVVLVACVSSGDDRVEGTGGATPRTFGTDDPRDDDARVKGERIVRGENGEPTEAPTEPPSSAPPAVTPAPPTGTPAAPPATSAPPVVAAPTAPPVATDAPDPEPVRVVEVIRIGLEDLPVETLGSRDGDNTVSFGWDEDAGGITAASSGTRFARGGGSELMTDLTTDDGAIVNALTLTNTHDDARLEVKGRLVHEVYSGSRLVARLRSAPIDEVLAPGGSVSARFTYLVPTGDYVVRARFETSQ